MANPQRENGHLDIANELVDAFCRHRISGQEWQIVWAVLRKTWGWVETDKKGNILYDERGLPLKKKMDRIPLSQFQQITGIDRRKCHKLIKGLVAKNVIIKSVVQKGDRREILYGIQKDYDQWKVSPKKVTVTNIGDKASSKEMTKLSSKKTPSKEKKETLENKYTKEAEALFSRYPRRTDRANSIQSIINELKSGTSIKDMEAALENYLAIIRRDGIQPRFVLGSKKFFSDRWKQYQDSTDTAGFHTGQPNRYNYPKCPLCLAEVSSIKLDEEGNLIYCPYCSD
jgi:DNA-directed RNA polymerase subunit RPC12/RpoP